MFDLGQFSSITHYSGRSYSGTNTGPANANWPTANQAMGNRIYIPNDFVIKKFFYVAQDVGGSNLDIGIYQDAPNAFTRLASTGSKPYGSTGVVNYIALTNPVKIKAGSYLLMMSQDGGGAGRIANFNSSSSQRISQIFQMNTAFPLPATLVPVIATGTYFIPWIGATSILSPW